MSVSVGPGDCELYPVGAGSQTRVLCKNSKHLEPLSHLSSPTFSFLKADIRPQTSADVGHRLCFRTGFCHSLVPLL